MNFTFRLTETLPPFNIVAPNSRTLPWCSMPTVSPASRSHGIPLPPGGEVSLDLVTERSPRLEFTDPLFWKVAMSLRTFPSFCRTSEIVGVEESHGVRAPTWRWMCTEHGQRSAVQANTSLTKLHPLLTAGITYTSHLTRGREWIRVEGSSRLVVNREETLVVR